jgi:AcrR family transcriptional regulator
MPKPDVSAERKAQILDAASIVFLKKGFDAARMEEIAAGAGLSIGGVYWYYKSKEEVILGLMDAITNTDLDDLHALLDAPGPVVERLAILFAALYEGMLEMAMLDPDNVQAVSELVNALDVLFLGLRP